jgi:hypothetical protein
MNLLNKLTNDKNNQLIYYAFLWLYFLSLIYLSYKLNIWEDEAYSLNTSSLGLGQVIHQSYHFEGQPPFYFLSLAVWRLINPGIFFARLFSVVCVALSTLVLKKYMNLMPVSRPSNWITAIFLLNPFTVWAATEIRTYALLILLSFLSIFFLTRYEIEKKQKDLLYFLTVCLTGLYTQYLFVFLIAAISLNTLIFKGWKPFFILSLQLLPVAILFTPSLTFLGENIKNFQSDDPGFSLHERFTIAFHNIQNIFLSLNLVKAKLFSRMILITVATLYVYAWFSLAKKRHDTSHERAFHTQQNDDLASSMWPSKNKFQTHGNYAFWMRYNSLLVTATWAVMFFTAYFVITGSKFNIRYFASVFPLFILLFMIFDTYSHQIRNLIFGTLSVYYIFLLFNKYNIPIKTYDYQSVAQYVEKIEKPGEPLVLNSRTISTPFEYYFNEKNRLIQLPDSFRFTKEGFQVVIKDTTELKLVLKQINSGSILFVNDNMLGYNSKLKLNEETANAFLKANYNITLDTLYAGRGKIPLRIRRLEVRNNKHP